MKVLAAIVLAPHWLTAGGPNAALRLSTALAKICDIDLARMAAADAMQRCDGLTIFDLRCSNPLSFARRVVPGSLFMLFYRARIPDLVRTKRYDIVHIHNPLPALEMRRVARACVETGVPYVVSTHGLVELSAPAQALALGRLQRMAWKPLVDAPFRYVVDHAARMMALSPADLPILDGLGYPADKITLIPNGVDIPASATPAGALERVCAKFGLPFPKPPGVPVGMFLANHTKNKGVAVLLEAFSAYDRPFRLIVAGSQRDHIDYDQYARRGTATQRFHFPGFVTDHEAAALMDYADVFVFPTLADTAPLVVLEAMAHGLPVLATRVGGIPYQVPESCGRLVEPGSPQALREGFAQLTSDRRQMASMGMAAKAHVARTFTWGASAEAALAVYRTILAGGNTTSPRTPGGPPKA